MASINLSTGDDVYSQPDSTKNEWNDYFGLEGHDTLRVFQGTLIGGPGNDRLERLPSTESWRTVGAAYWNSPAGIVANLAESWVDDGFGTRDTVVGVTVVHGSGRDDRFIGDAADNFFYPNGGRDHIDGGAGWDGFDVHEIPPDATGGGLWRPARLEDLDITVAVDGRSATFAVKHYPQFAYTVANIEYFRLIETDNTQYPLADFIRQQDMATQAIAAGGSARWNAAQPLGTPVTVTFSFVTQSAVAGFRAFTPAEQQLVRDILAKTSALANIAFAEVAESGATVGQLRFAVSQQAATKGQAFAPGQGGEAAGDVWMDVESMAGIAPGSEGYQALVHEIGHALGLRHPRNTDPADGWATQLREQDDRTALTVMSQARSSDGLFRAEWGPLDVLALRHLYGSRSANPGDTVYTLGGRESGAQTTIVDDGGADLIDASALPAGANLDLTPGRLSSAGFTGAGFAGIENLALSSTTLIENAIGTRLDDVLTGNDAPNLLTGGPGNDWIDGGKGTDTAAFAGKRSDYEVSHAFGRVQVMARDGVSGFDTLGGIECLAFADQTVQLSPVVLGADMRASVDEDRVLTTLLPAPSDLVRSQASYRLLAPPAAGTATIAADGKLEYTPRPDYHGADVVAYELAGAAGSNRYLVFVSVLPVNDGAPVARDAALLAPAGATLRGALPAASDVDRDPVTYSLAAEPRNGSVSVAPDGGFAYTPRAGHQGADSFGFTVSDGQGGSNTYTAQVTVMPVAALREGSAGADVISGQAAGEGLIALAGNDRITGAGGDDLIDGGLGIDTAVYAGGRNQFLVAKADYGWRVEDTVGGEGKDRLAGIERLAFANTNLALDLDGNAGAVAQILRALFGPAWLANKSAVGIGLSLFDAGASYADVVALAIGTPQFESLAGGRSNTAFVATVYRNVVGTLPSAAELQHFVSLLDSGSSTQAALGLLACQATLNAQSIDLVGLAATGIEFTPPA
jgi:Ca2+-binding RTX toxin-like protein